MDFETIKFISLLNQLAEKSKNGYIPFSKATAKNKNCILSMMKAHIVTIIPLYTTLV